MQKCPACRFANPVDFFFCGRCGNSLRQEASPELLSAADGSQRRYLTVVFTDLTGYTGLCEDLDPEEVREVMGAVFAEIDRIVRVYDGCVFKLLGDSALILFGYPQAHEDDPVRAVRAALEIHAGVRELNSGLDRRLKAPLCMHSGLNTGLTLIEWADSRRTRQEVAGDAVNVASRLCLLARPGEILLGLSTYQQVVGCFECHGPQEVQVKGKTDPVRAYRVSAARDEPLRHIRAGGLKAGLVGRQKEMDSLRRAVACFLQGKKVVVEICGGAGSGKTRLVQELKLELNLNEVQWSQGYAYAYRDSIPYFPIIDLLKRLWGIKEDDPRATVQSKVESGFAGLLGDSSGLLPYVGSLFSIDYPELEGVGPESWRENFFQAVEALFKALLLKGPLIVCLEDLHWADRECLNLLHRFFTRFEKPVLFVCVYRDEGTLWPDQGEDALDAERFLVRTNELSKPETMAMLRSLLGADHLPLELERFVEDRIEGNPFYLTEVVNSLIESGLLIRSGSGWRVAREMTETEVPLTIHGLLSARIDRLDRACRKILQEASVFGRSFLYQVIERVSACEEELDGSLSLLEHMALITKSGESDGIEFVFNHALAQEVVYSGLLKSERRLIHDKIARVMELLFADRLHEFFETLAFHFKRAGQSRQAVFYLLKSGRKSLSRHALDQAHAHYQEAMELVSKELAGEAELRVELLVQWAFVYYYRGCFQDLLTLLQENETLAGSVGSQSSAGMYFSWLGCALWHRERFEEAYRYLTMSLQMGETIGDNRVVGYASAWMAWTCSDLGLLAEAGEYAQKAQQSYLSGESEFYVYYNSLAGEGYAFWHRGDVEGALERGRMLIQEGNTHSDNRCTVMGHCSLGWGYLAAGNQEAAISCFQTAVYCAMDPWYALIPKLALCYGLIANARIDEAELLIQEILDLSGRYGVEFVGTPAEFFHGVALAVSGDRQKGVRIMEDTLDFWEKNNCRLRFASCSLILARVYAAGYLRIKQGGQSGLFQKMGRGLMQGMAARKKAVALLEQCLAAAQEIGALGLQGQAHLELARIHASRGKREKTARTLGQAIHCLEECGAKGYLQEARELQQTLENKAM